MSTHITYRPQDLDARKLHGCLLGGIAPRPIAFVSTVGGQGRVNLAPFSYFNVFSANPPMVIFSPRTSRSGRHDKAHLGQRSGGEGSGGQPGGSRAGARLLAREHRLRGRRR